MPYDFNKWNKLPGISCWCNTFAREELLEEAIYSFLVQDYPGEKELVILNDYEEQELVYDHPEVKVFNLKERIPTLARKGYETIERCKYEYLAPWASDDVSFPSRLSRSIERMHIGGPLFHLPSDPKNYQFYAPGGWFISEIMKDNYKCTYVESFDMGACLFSHKAYVEGKPYDLDSLMCIDAQIQEKLRILGYWSFDRNLPADQAFYIYRRFLADEKWYPHVLAARTMGDKGTDLSKAQEHLAKYAKKGKIELKPHWKMDYMNLNG